MTAAELIERLRQYPTDMLVFVQGYETGWDGIHALREADLTINANAEDWDGEYEEPSRLEHSKKGADTLPAKTVLIVGKRGHLR